MDAEIASQDFDNCFGKVNEWAISSALTIFESLYQFSICLIHTYSI